MKKAAGKYKTDSFLYVLLYQRPDPVQEPQHPARKDPVQDDRSGNSKDLAPDPEDLPLLFVLDRRSGDRVGKPGDGNEGSGAAPFCDAGIDPGPGEDNACQHKDERSPVAAFFRGKSLRLTIVEDDLPEEADGAADQESLEHICPDVMFGRFLFYVRFILLLLFHFLYFIHIVYSFRCPTNGSDKVSIWVLLRIMHKFSVSRKDNNGKGGRKRWIR